jgi:hypothetical protein
VTGTGGYGYNWGQELLPTYFFQTIDDENVHILLHEMGHVFGLLGMFEFDSCQEKECTLTEALDFYE